MSKQEEPTKAEQTEQAEFLVVAIGASAGGLRAFKDFLGATPPESGMAFVLIQHLDPNHESELSELLQNGTAMKVTQVEADSAVEPNCVYVIPPNKHLSIEKGVLKLSARPERRGSHAVIDLFFRSLATDLGKRAVAVVLSGTGTDGSQGIKLVKENGGVTLAQSDPEYDGMPRSAVATGLVDFELPAAEMPAKLSQLKDNTAQIKLDPNDTLPDDESGILQRIFAQVQSRTGYDFSHYKRNTVLRRVGRRMQVHGVSELNKYLTYLRKHEAEAEELVKELLISVTNFFRDPDAFKALEDKIIPALFGGDEVRVWVSGCATGEEAYSLAILLAEHNSARSKPLALQIFASDISAEALEVARRGVYPDSAAADLSPERLKRFFDRRGSNLHVKPELREMVMFTQHNLLKDPPFARLNLVTCRNLLIYLDAEAQEQVYQTFHYALRPDSFLFLGASESLGQASSLFTQIDKRAKLFKQRGRVRPKVTPYFESAAKDVRREAASSQAPSLAELARQTVLEQHALAFIVVNKRYDIVYISSGASRYLEQPEGEPTRNVLEQAKAGLRVDLRAALYRIFRRDQVTRAKPVSLGKGEAVELSVTTLQGASGHALVTFRERSKDSSEDVADGSSAEEQTLAAQLEDELRHTRESLQTTIEELETSNEELRASNEELQSVNEELQSTGEELETSREELQSTNEELTTINEELRSKIIELAQANGDLENFISATEIGTLFLDTELRLKRYTPAATKVFNLIDADIGRPFSHLSHRLEVENLLERATQVLDTLQPQEFEAKTGSAAAEAETNAEVFTLRLLPYRRPDNRIDGVVLTLSNVTKLNQVEQELRVLNEELEASVKVRTAELQRERDFTANLIQSSQDGILAFDTDLRYTVFNEGMMHISGVGTEQAVGNYTYEVFPFLEEIGELDVQRETLAGKSQLRENQPFTVPETGESGYFDARYSPLRDEDGAVIGGLAVVRETTERKEAEDDLKASEERFRAVFEQGPAATCLLILDNWTVIDANDKCEDVLGYKRGDLTGNSLLELPLWQDRQQLASLETLINDEDDVRELELNVVRSREAGVLRASLELITFGGAEHVLLIFDDITQQVRAEQELRETRQRLVEVQDRERAALARELHDDVIQGLLGLNNTLALFERSEELEGNLSRPRAEVLELTNQLRRTISELRPAGLEEFGLKDALEGFAEGIHREQAGSPEISCQLSEPGDLDDAQTRALFRVAQEALRNAVRHAGADHVKIDLQRSADALILSIRDDGRGFAPPEHFNELAREGHFGLLGMEERVTLLGGSLDVKAAPGRGTTVTASLPLDGSRAAL